MIRNGYYYDYASESMFILYHFSRFISYVTTHSELIQSPFSDRIFPRNSSGWGRFLLSLLVL